MSTGRVALVARIPGMDGWKDSRWVTVKRLKSGEPKFEARFAGARFALRYALPDGKQRLETLPSDMEWVAASAEVRQRERNNEIEALGGTAPNHADRKTVSENAKWYLAEIEKMCPTVFAVRTVATYKRTVLRFCEMFGALFMDEVRRDHINTFLKECETNLRTRAGGGDRKATLRAITQNLSAFWKFEKKQDADGRATDEPRYTFPLPISLWAVKTKRVAKAFTDEQLSALLSVADDDEADLILFFVYTGFRDDEAAHTYYSDFDHSNPDEVTVNVSAKPEWGFRIKNQKARESALTVPSDYVERIKARVARRGVALDSRSLIFPNKNGRPWQALLEAVRRVAKRAGVEMPPGTGLHKFRKTFATRYAKIFGLRATQIRLGHADIATTQRYLADEVTSTKDVNEAFAGIRKGKP